MNKNQNPPPDATEVRRRAEQRLSARAQTPQSAIRNPQSEQRLVHELEVHQIELEMQNEELQQARAKLDALLAQYTDLYDFAPTGYLTLDCEGAIRQLNLTVARLLGIERARLLTRRFGLFVAEGDRRAFSDFLERVFASQTQECCEVALPQEGHHPLWVRIEGKRSADGQECLAVMVDLTERKRAEEERERIFRWGQGVNLLQQSLLAPAPLEDKLRSVTDNIVRLFGADFCRVWLIRPGDLCERGCVHAEAKEGPHICRYRDRCLHLLASSGRYTHLDGQAHRRIPLGAYKIGRLASGEDHKFLTNDVTNDPLVHNHEWARELGLVSFAGYQLRIPGAETLGVLALFAKHPILPAEAALLDGLSSTLAQTIQQAQAEEALRASEEESRSLFENTHDAIMTLAPPSWRFASGNLATLKMFGAKKKEEFIGDVPWGLSPERQPDGRASAEKAKEMIETAMREGSHFFEWTHRRIGGQEFPTDVFLTRMEQRGEVILHATIREITERKNSDRRIAAFSNLGQKLSAAKTAREAAEIIVEVADHLLGWDACSFALFSPTEKLMRHVLTRDTVDGRRVDTSSAYEPHSPPSPLANRAIVEGGLLILKEEPDRMQPGGLPFGDTLRPSASLLFVPIRNGTDVIGVMSIQSYTPKAYDQRSLDTLQALADHCGAALDRIRTGEALRSSQARLQLQFDHMPLACITWDREQRVTSWNPAAERIFGYTATEALGKQPHDLIVPKQLQPPADSVGQHLLEGEVDLHTVKENQTKDGRAIFCDWTSVPLRSPDGSIVGVLSMVQDVTESRRLEQQFRQSQKMEAIGQLAGGVAHDFNNMLAVIRGNVELLLMHPNQHKPRTRECLKQVVAASEHAANLTRQLLAFSRKRVMQSRPLVLNDVIMDLTKMLRQVIGEHIDLQCGYGAQLPFVQADPGMIEQVLVNLAVNARDAMPQGGQLLITTEPVTFDGARAPAHPEARAGQFVCLAVKDAGTGIAPGHLPRIFEPFFTTKEPGKGTGLGLATVYRIVKQHRGWIEVSSQPGAGATFTIFLPAIPPPARTAATPQTEANLPGGTETILLVEDDYSVRMTARRVLESHGYKILEAASAPEALDLWRRRAKEIALLLSDVVMPEGVMGRELAEQLRATSPTLKVIFMSGYTADVIGKDTDSFQRTRNYFLQKPWSSHALLETVRACLDAK